MGLYADLSPKLHGVEYTSGTGNFTVPANVYEIEYELVGAGSGSGSGGFDSNAANTAGGGASGSPGVYERGKMKVIPGQVIPYVVGAKGNGGAAVSSSGAGNAGSDGGNSYFGGIVAFGGKAGQGGQRAGGTGTSEGGTAGASPIAISTLYFDGPGRDSGGVDYFQVLGKTIYSDLWRTIVAALGIVGYNSAGYGTATERYGPAVSGGNATRAGGGAAGVSTPVGIGGNGSAGVNAGASAAGANATGYGASGGASGGCSGGTGTGKGGDGAGGRVSVWWQA